MMAWYSILRRTRVKPRRAKPRKGRVYDQNYLDWIHTQPSIVPTHAPECWRTVCSMTAHHVREYGSPKDDTATVPLFACHHMHAFGHATMEHGKRAFEERHNLSLEAEIARLRALYLATEQAQ